MPIIPPGRTLGEKDDRRMLHSLVLFVSLALPAFVGLTLHQRDNPSVVGLDIKRRDVTDHVARDQARRKRDNTVSQALDNGVRRAPPKSEWYTNAPLGNPLLLQRHVRDPKTKFAPGDRHRQ